MRVGRELGRTTSTSPCRIRPESVTVLETGSPIRRGRANTLPRPGRPHPGLPKEIARLTGRRVTSVRPVDWRSRRRRGEDAEARTGARLGDRNGAEQAGGHLAFEGDVVFAALELGLRKLAPDGPGRMAHGRAFHPGERRAVEDLLARRFVHGLESGDPDPVLLARAGSRPRFQSRSCRSLSFAPTSYFWRTYDHQEIDLIEEWGGRIDAAEMKWSPRSKVRPPRGWSEAYPGSMFRVVHRDNYLDFITGR